MILLVSNKTIRPNNNYIPNMEQSAQFSFEKFSKLDLKYINFSNTDLLNKCRITRIMGNESADKVMELHYRLELQHKIIDFQYEQIDKIYDEFCLRSNNSDKRVTVSEKKYLDNINHINSNDIKRHSDLNILAQLQNYRNTYSSITKSEIIAESLYIRKLLMETGIQRTILFKQQDQILDIAKTVIASKMSQQKPTPIENTGLTLQLCTDQDFINNAKLVNKMQTNQPLNSNTGLRIMTLEQFMDKHNISKTSIPTKKSKQKKKIIIDECCVCFDKINQKIGLVPCGHTTVCEKCAVNICGKNCPICRETFTQYVKLYL